MSRRRRIGRRLVFAAAGFLVLALLVAGGGIAFLTRTNLAPYFAGYAGERVGREVTVESLRLGWQDGVTVELRGVRIANAEWSETPEMASVASARARLDAAALWRGLLRYEKLEVDGLRVTLERGPERVGNWEFKQRLPRPGPMVPGERGGFPSLLDAVMRDAQITYRTTSGQVLKIELDEVTIQSPGDDQPVALAATGAYNDVAVTFTGTGESFDTFRQTGEPYGLKFAIVSASGITHATFDGTLTEPLDFDGADGQLQISATDTGELGQIFGATVGVTFPLEIGGHMTRTRDDWRLGEAQGVVAGNSFTGALQLVEGGPGEPDDVTAQLAFPELDIGPLLGDAAPSGGMLETPLGLDEAPGINLDVDISTGSFIAGSTRLADAVLVGRVAGREITVERLAFALAGGGVTLSGKSEAAENSGRITLDAALDGIDAAEVAAMIGAAPGEVSGRFDGRATLGMAGVTLKDALAASSGHAVIAMREGRVARAILEMAATDLRSLFRDKEGSTRVECLLGVVDLENGVGRVPHLELRTADATLNGGGSVDLVGQRIDMTFMTAPDSTGFFALDVPFRVHGSLQDPSIDPLLGGGRKPGEFPVAASQGGAMPAAMKEMVQGNPCRG
jgi:uncharacterized protein involved in outer membrane biogenesis